MRIFDGQDHQGAIRSKIGREQCIARRLQCLGPVLAETGDDLRMGGLFRTDKHFRFDAKGIGNPFHPLQRQVPHSGL